MKKILLLNHCAIMIFFILSTSLWAGDPNDRIEVHGIYKGVKLAISGSYISAHKALTNDSEAMNNINSPIPHPDDIMTNLKNRFTEMADKYDKAEKSVLPSCLKNKLYEFLSALKSGEKGLTISWWKKDDTPWQLLHGDSDFTGIGRKSEIHINDTFLEKFHTYKDVNGNYVLKEVLTSASLFHELVHTVKKNYPECFKELEVQNLEEISADWAARKIFGKDITKTVYIDASGDQETDMCTYKIVCKCDCEDKSGRKFSEQSSSDSDEGCESDPPAGDEGPAGDKPDDNYSYFRGIIKEYNLAPEALIFTSGHWQEALKLFGGLEFDKNNTAEKLLKVTPFLVIPTGALSSVEYNSTFKYILEQYVNLGGSIIVFGQQYGAHIDNVVPVPEEESLKSYGWREDQSCLRFSTYFETNHPVLSSSTNELINAGVDGYFSTYPSNSTTLLMRKVNREPALLYYPYENGTVILTSMFTDWAYAHSQSTTAELRIIRDLITFAKNPKLPIPMFDLEQNPTPTIVLNVQVKNNTEYIASKAKLMVYTPDRNILLYELEVPINLNQGETTQTAINFTLPELQTKDYGICHVDYELYNAENEIIQLPTESDSGRFSIYKIITPVTIKDAVYMWVTVKDENVYWGQDAEFTIHFKNTRSESRTLDINNPFFSIGHGGSEGPSFPSFQVILPPGEEYQHNVSLPTTQFNSYVKSAITVRIQYYDANGVLKQTGPAKVIFLKFFNF